MPSGLRNGLAVGRAGRCDRSRTVAEEPAECRPGRHRNRRRRARCPVGTPTQRPEPPGPLDQTIRWAYPGEGSERAGGALPARASGPRRQRARSSRPPRSALSSLSQLGRHVRAPQRRLRRRLLAHHNHRPMRMADQALTGRAQQQPAQTTATAAADHDQLRADCRISAELQERIRGPAPQDHLPHRHIGILVPPAGDLLAQHGVLFFVLELPDLGGAAVSTQRQVVPHQDGVEYVAPRRSASSKA